jgi:hypothetical protein
MHFRVQTVCQRVLAVHVYCVCCVKRQAVLYGNIE